MSATADSSDGEFSEVKHLWLFLRRIVPEMVRDSSLYSE
jgi:hypothetical protein